MHSGTLSRLAYDDVVQSIGYGQTDKLSNLMGVSEISPPAAPEVKNKPENQEVAQENIEENNAILDDVPVCTIPRQTLFF